MALQGRVSVKVSSINGPIAVGDELTSSSIPGVAMLASTSGQTIGKALETYSNADPNAVGKIMAFVNLTYYSAPTTITDNGDVMLTATAQSQQNLNPTLSNDNLASNSASETQAASSSSTLETKWERQQLHPSTIYNSIASPERFRE